MPERHTDGHAVLIVEDNEATREAFALIIACEGFRVLTADNGEEALEVLRRETPCVILLDMMMPVMDGAEFLAKRAEQDRLAEIPVILCTASGERKRRGAAELLAKPVDPSELVAAVRRHC
jgi:two-component system chemotaxis response regulator CheY